MILDVETTNEAIKSTGDVIKLYHEVLDRVVPWKAFNETMINLDRYKEQYSNQSAEIIAEIKSLMMDGIGAYYRASEFMFSWCDESIPLLATYIELFDDHTVGKAHTQKDLLIDVLTKGVAQMRAAQQAIGDSSINFNQATGKLTTLNSRFQVEFDEKSDYFKAQVDKMRKFYVKGAARGLFGAIIVGIFVETKYIPKLKAKTAEINDFYQKLKLKIDTAFRDVEDTKNKLNNEVLEVGELKVKTKETKSFIDLDDIPDLRDTLRESAQNLIDDCNEYRRKHAEKMS